ncbi:hypothetical protein Y032_0170g265 [Ancylostoma ceylanicum]|uniref:Haemolysin-III related n=1 Tax=Ancylostoma ceylanicum TaxID=53326 RepID=A0A016SVQ4_9BILA|nr:hypothetical protein Y032_0170g265 [Ancylostoma ceylanicum]
MKGFSPHSDDISQVCSRQLRLLRVQLKDKLRSFFNGECSVEDLVQHTGLKREAVIAILEKHNAFLGDENDQQRYEDPEQRTPSPVIAENQPCGNNVTFTVPRLDISDVRNDAASSDDSMTPKGVGDVIQQIPRPPQPSAPLQSLTMNSVQEPTVLPNQSPREVTDSSAEISDLAKKLGARLFQDTSILEQLRSVKREKSFVEQLREIVASSAVTETSVKQLQFIHSTPIARRTFPVKIECKEIDVQTSIRIGELPVIAKEMRDIATDLPSLDYLSMSELGGLRQLPDTFIVQEDVSSSAFSSDQSAGQVPGSLISRVRTTIAVNRDGSAQFTPSKVVRVSELVEDSFPSQSVDRQSRYSPPPPVLDRPDAVTNASPRTPRVSESPWRPSSRRLRLEEVEISTSQESNSIEVVSVGTPARRPTVTRQPHPNESNAVQGGEAHAPSVGRCASSARGEHEGIPVVRMSGNCGIVNPSLYKNKRAAKGEAYEPTTYEHWANTISHGIGIVPSIIVFQHMISIAHRDLQFYLMIIYGLFTTLLFSSSTCYHACELKYRQKREQPQLRYYLHICDRAAIYLFIAASYTPWLTLRHCGYPGLSLKWMIWVFALLGIIYQYNFHERYKTLETVIYVLVAGCPSVAIFTMAS